MMQQQRSDAGAAAGTDLFLSYSRADAREVETLRTLIQARGLSTFYDRDQLQVGLPWPDALEQGLRGTRGVAVFIGPTGLGLWQKREMSFALDRQAAEEKEGRAFPVIPVLLPGADTTPGFLFLNTWVDFRHNATDPAGLDALAKVMRGEATEERDRAVAALCPYRGLRPFDEESAAFFHGRDAFSERIFNAVLIHNLVAVLGPSGTGKSSIVQAGVLPRLRRRHPPDATWDAAHFVPGDRPFHHLAVALLGLLDADMDEMELLARSQQLADDFISGSLRLQDAVRRVLTKSGGTDRLLLVADQFEELFTMTPDAERQAFLEFLLRGLDRAPLNVVITMRGSFYDRLIATSRQISDRLEQATINLGPMTREELRKAVEEPARCVGLQFEPGLVERILKDVGNEPGNLPLLEFALTELWERRKQRWLTHTAYEAIEGVAGAIVQRAESVFLGLRPADQDIARRVMIRLVWVGGSSEGEQQARQRLRLADLDPEAEPVIQVMADARLLVVGRLGAQGETTAEMAHEALIRGWTRLHGWLDEDREFLLWRRRLRAALEIRKAAEQDEATLLRGTPLREAENWLLRREQDLAPEERAFIQAGLALSLREQKIRERRIRRAIVASAMAGVVLLVLSTVAVMKSLASISQELAAHARALLDVDPEASVLLGIEAVKMHVTEEADGILKLALEQSLMVARADDIHRLSHVAFGPDGKTVVAMGADKAARAWEWQAARLVPSHWLAALPRPIKGFALSPDGTRTVVWRPDGSAALVAAASGRVVAELRGHDKPVVAAAFSPTNDGRVVTASDDGTARVWDAAQGRVLQILKGHRDRLTRAEFSPDGKRIVTAAWDLSAILWDAGTGRLLHRLAGHAAPLSAAGFSPDGELVVTASGDNTAAVWEVRNGQRLAVLRGHTDSITDAAFSHSGPFLVIVTASMDRTARVWKSTENRQSWQTVNFLRGHAEGLTGVAFGRDGRYVATTGADRTVRIWDALTEQARDALFGHTAAVDGAEFSSDGHRVISYSSDNTARVWSLAKDHEVSGAAVPVVLVGHRDSLTAASFSGDGDLVVTASLSATARIWDPATGQLVHRLKGHSDRLNGAVFDRTGSLVVTASDDATARIWNVHTGQVEKVLDGHADRSAAPHHEGTADIAFSPDGILVARVEVEQDHVVRVEAVESGKLVAELPGHRDELTGVAFSPKGELLATTSRDSTARLWDTRTWQIRAELSGHNGTVNGAAFSADGSRLVTASDDRTARVWDTATGAAMGQPLHHEAAVTESAFTAHGRRVVTTTATHEVRLWDIADGRLLGKICADCEPLPGHSGRVVSARFSPDSRWVVTASADHTARVWSVATGRVVCVLEGHEGPLVKAVFSPDGEYVLTASYDHTARLWRRDNDLFRPHRVLRGHDDELTDAVFSPDGQWIATAGQDFTARVWRTATGTAEAIFDAHEDWVNSVEFSPDSRLLVTASRDGTARLWDLRDGSSPLQLRGHRASVNQAHFDARGENVVTASSDGTVRVWNLANLRAGKSCPICSSSMEEICRSAHARVRRALSPREREKYHVPGFIDLFRFRCAG